VTAALLVLGMLLLFALNMPIAIAIGTAASLAIVVQGDFSLMMVVQRLIAGTDSFHLLAVPLFMFAGILMEKGGISRRLIALADALVGWLPGGLAAAAIVSAMFFAGVSGSAAADTAAVGAVLIPAMKRAGYGSGFSAAVQAAGGSTGVVIPPSIPMILFGFLTGASIGKLFAAGILPGLLIGGSLIAVASFSAWQRGVAVNRRFSAAALGRAFTEALLPLGAPAIILGGILTGVFTATESAAVAVVYALVVGMLVYRKIRPADLPALIIDGSVTTAIVMFIIATASVFGWVAAIEELPARLSAGLLTLTDDPVLLLLIINLLLLIAGTIVETTAALILFVPLITAMQPVLGIDLLHLGVIVVANLAIGMLTPPMGICLIVSGAISGDTITRVSHRILPFLAVLIFDLLIISFWADLSLFLPGLMER
jgi:tripartite ATP-independent transporter DctM subunit